MVKKIKVREIQIYLGNLSEEGRREFPKTFKKVWQILFYTDAIPKCAWTSTGVPLACAVVKKVPTFLPLIILTRAFSSHPLQITTEQLLLSASLAAFTWWRRRGEKGKILNDWFRCNFYKILNDPKVACNSTGCKRVNDTR